MDGKLTNEPPNIKIYIKTNDKKEKEKRWPTLTVK